MSVYSLWLYSLLLHAIENTLDLLQFVGWQMLLQALIKILQFECRHCCQVSTGYYRCRGRGGGKYKGSAHTLSHKHRQRQRRTECNHSRLAHNEECAQRAIASRSCLQNLLSLSLLLLSLSLRYLSLSLCLSRALSAESNGNINP